MTWQIRSSEVADDPNYTGPVLRDAAQIILNATLDGVIIQSEDHKVEFANGAATKLFGDRIEQVCHELVEQAEHHPVCPIHCIVDEAGETEGFCYDGDGKHLRVLVTGSNGEEGIPKNVVVVRDITSIKKLQQELEQSQKLRALGQMTLGIAHDFSNVLSAVLSRSQLLQQRLHDRRALESGLKAIEKLALDATKTTQRMQHFAGSTKDTGFAPVDLNEVINYVVQITRPRWQDQAQKDGSSITVFVRSGKVPPIMGNASDLQEALTNLMLNSVEAISHDGIIKIRTFSDKDSVYVSVSDTGTGMSEQVAQRAFEPFFTTRGADNLGLGLGIVRSIVESHHGEVAIDREQGHGTAITMRFPVPKDEENTKRPVLLPDKGTSASVLVVDDQPIIRELFHEILIRDGHTITLASDSREGLHAFDEGYYDIVYTDLGMPGVSGWEVASEIRKRKPDTMVVMITGWEIQMSKEELSKSGVDLILTKPFQIQQLRDSVVQAMKIKKKR